MTTTEYSHLYNTDMEVEVIAALISEINVFDNIINDLDASFFNDYDCQKAFNVLKEIASEGRRPDYYQMGSLLAKEKVSITKFIVDHHCGLELTRQRIEWLNNLSIRRKVAATFYKGESMMCDLTLSMDELQPLFKEIDDIFNKSGKEEVQKFSEIIRSLMNDVANRKEDKGEMGIMTGLHIFDSRYGWHGGDLVIIAGETSMGKSTLATTIAYNMGVNNVASAYYSMEMSAKQLAARIIARRTRVSSSMTLYDKLSDEEYNRVFDGSLEMKKLPIFFDEDCKTSFARIIGSIRRMVKNYGVKVVFIDYLQILANGHGDNREQLIGDMARDLKRLAVELNIVIVALSQLARSIGAKEPSINRMRGSGQIEEACDIAVLISRQQKNSDQAKLQIAKGRNIGLAVESVKFDRNLSYFSDFSENELQSQYIERTEKLPF